MTHLPAPPIPADDPLAYYAPLTALPARAARPKPPISAIEQMYGYYTAEGGGQSGTIPNLTPAALARIPKWNCRR